MNEERPIEKLLRRYAKKRRDATPESPGLEMHPATRRLLQGEVKRQFSKNAAQEKSSAPFWKIWWPRLIWALPVLLVLVVGVWALIGPDKKNVTEFELARNETLSAPAEMAKKSPIAGAASSSDDSKLLAAATATPAPLAAAPPVLALSESSVAYSDSARAEEPVNQPLGSRAKSLELDRNGKLDDETVKLKATSTLALPPQLEGSDHELNQKADRARATVAEVAATTRADKLETYSARGGSAVSSAIPATANVDGFGAAQAFKQNLDYLGMNARYAVVANAGDVSPVLTNFQVEQNGNELRVIDSDGSTYAGSVGLAGVDKDSRTAAEFKEKAPELQRDYRRLPQPSGAASGDKVQAGQLYFFRVTGTNRTLQQPVIFTGNFVTLTNLPAKTLTVTGGLAGETQPARGQLASPALFNSSINGRAQLGAGREFEINAQPVKP